MRLRQGEPGYAQRPLGINKAYREYRYSRTHPVIPAKAGIQCLYPYNEEIIKDSGHSLTPALSYGEREKSIGNHGR